MIVYRRQMSRTAHRIGFGRINQRLRRVAASIVAPAPIGHNSSTASVNEPEWLKELPMSDEWNNNQPHPDYQPQDQFQHQPEYHQPEHQHFEPTSDQGHDQSPESSAEPAPAAVGFDTARLEAIEAALNELRGHVHELKASIEARDVAHTAAEPEPAVTEPEVVAEPAPVDPAPVESAIEEPTHVEEPAVGIHDDRLASIETELATIRTLIGAVAHTLADVQSDVKSHTGLHAETKALVDDQQQLLRGLSYIITSAIGTLTASAKSVK